MVWEFTTWKKSVAKSALTTASSDKLLKNFSGGERHAKTLEIAQGEVITCLGLCVYERLQRIHMRLKEEETVCQVLVAVAIDALNRKFQVFWFLLFF